MKYTVEKPDVGTRFDSYLAKAAGVARNVAARMLRHNEANVNGKPANASYRMKENDVVTTIPKNPDDLNAEKGELTILFEDKNFLAVDKPAGLTVHATAERKSGTLVNQLLAVYPAIRTVGEVHRPGLVHRLDRDVSGVMVIAKTPEAYEHLKEQFADREVAKEYAALVLGSTKHEDDTINSPLGRNRKGRISVKEDGLPAITHYEVIKRGKKSTLLRIKTETGRMHQIRVHLMSIGHPIVGDKFYAPDNARVKSKRLMLHATKVTFTNLAGTEVTVESKLPSDFLATP